MTSPTVYIASIESGPAGRGYDIVQFTAEAEHEPSCTAHVRHHDGMITWMSEWALVPELEACGQLHHIHRGQNTYGHVDVYFS